MKLNPPLQHSNDEGETSRCRENHDQKAASAERPEQVQARRLLRSMPMAASPSPPFPSAGWRVGTDNRQGRLDRRSRRPRILPADRPLARLRRRDPCARMVVRDLHLGRGSCRRDRAHRSVHDRACALVHPLYAAKALATVDHISNGRAGLNIVCGWNPAEFAMFGATIGEDAYGQAAEWIEHRRAAYAADRALRLRRQILRSEGRRQPPRQPAAPRPVTMNAAFGPPGGTLRRGTATICSRLFTEIADGHRHIADIRPSGRGRPRRRRLHRLPRRLPGNPGGGRGLLPALRL